MRESITIRPAEPRDIETITQFNVAMARETEDKRLSVPVVARGVQSLLDNPKYGFYVVAEVEGRVVGSLMVTYEWSDWRCGLFWWIQSVYVRPDFRRRGVFRRLYEFLKQLASKDPLVCGFRLYFEGSNDTAQSAYAKLGMTRTSYGIFEQHLRR